MAASLVVLGLAATLLLTLGCYLCVHCLTPPPDEKKKKKEEELASPYKVHSYVGYQETDDAPVPVPVVYPAYVVPFLRLPPPLSLPSPPLVPPPTPKDDDLAKKEKGGYAVHSKETVATFKGGHG